jgi:uncharacterized membrane protein
MIKNLEVKLRYSRYTTWISYFLFILSLVVGGVVEGTPASLLVIVTLPLIIFLPGMARENYKSLAMLSFVTLMYFVPLVVNVMESDASIFDVTSVTMISILFMASMLFSRWRQFFDAGYGRPPQNKESHS